MPQQYYTGTPSRLRCGASTVYFLCSVDSSETVGRPCSACASDELPYPRCIYLGRKLPLSIPLSLTQVHTVTLEVDGAYKSLLQNL